MAPDESQQDPLSLQPEEAGQTPDEGDAAPPQESSNGPAETSAESAEQEQAAEVRVIGKCRIEGEIGRGGMGVVFRGWHADLEMDVAVKTLPRHLAEQPGMATRFLREARLAARLKHPGVVGVIDCGQDAHDYYLVMEFIDGMSLQQRLEDEGRLPVDEALRITRGVAEALGAAHEQLKLIHRDIKPDNILLTAQGQVKVADLGLARVAHGDQALTQGLTQTGAGMGTPYYMSPEQYKDAGHVDHRADIFSLGATLYHMLTGSRPFSGGSVYEIMRQVIEDDPAPLPETTPPQVVALLQRMLAKNPDDRFQTYEEVVAAVSQAAQGEQTLMLGGTLDLGAAPAEVRLGSSSRFGSGTQVRSTTPEPSDATATRLSPTAATMQMAPSRSWMPWAIAGTVLAAIAVTVILVVALSGPSAEEIAEQERQAELARQQQQQQEDEQRRRDQERQRQEAQRQAEAAAAAAQKRFEEAMAAAREALDAGALNDAASHMQTALEARSDDDVDAQLALLQSLIPVAEEMTQEEALTPPQLASLRTKLDTAIAQARTQARSALQRVIDATTEELRGREKAEFQRRYRLALQHLKANDGTAALSAIDEALPLNKTKEEKHRLDTLRLLANATVQADRLAQMPDSKELEGVATMLERVAGTVSGEIRADCDPILKPLMARLEKLRHVADVNEAVLNQQWSDAWDALQAATAAGVEAEALREQKQKIVSALAPPKRREGPLGVDLVLIPGGTFTMGDQTDGPPHQVTVSSFYMGAHEVTNAQFEAFRKRARALPAEVSVEGSKPVNRVSWNDAINFCSYLSSLDPQGVYRLPTEAEWEYAARGTANRTYPWGEATPTARHANLLGPADGYPQLAPVGRFPRGATPEGVQDMIGNVAEWCADWVAEYRGEPQTDPTGPDVGTHRCVRGSAMAYSPREWSRASTRSLAKPDDRLDTVGFRVVRMLSDRERKFMQLAREQASGEKK